MEFNKTYPLSYPETGHQGPIVQEGEAPSIDDWKQMEMPLMKRAYLYGKIIDHDYPIDHDYLPFDVFSYCFKGIDTGMHYSAAEIVTNGYQTDIKTPNATEQWELHQQDWRAVTDGNTNKAYNYAPAGYFSDDSQPG